MLHSPCVHPPQQILVAHDLSPEADRALQRAIQLTRLHAAQLSVVHVTHQPMPPDVEIATLKQLQQRLPTALALEAKYYVRQGPLVHTLRQLQQGLAADLLILGSHHAHAPRGFAGTTLEGLLAETSVPILLVNQAVTRPYQRALAAVDFSTAATHALCCMWPLLAEEAELQVLNVLEQAEIKPPTTEDLALQDELLQQWLATLRRQLPNQAQPITLVQRHGERRRCLEQLIQEWAPDILALGIHNRGTLSQALVGGLAYELLEQPPCDLLLAKSAHPLL